MKKYLLLIFSLVLFSCKPYVVVLECQHIGFSHGATTTPGRSVLPIMQTGPYTLTPWTSPQLNILGDTIKTGH